MKLMSWWRAARGDAIGREFHWGIVWSMLRSKYHVAVMRIDNRIQDARARLAGACNASTWNEELNAYEGGYSHWRCGKARGHADTAHRFINYVWEGPGHRVEYAPLPIRNEDNTGWFDTLTVIPFRKLADGRRAVASRRRSRLQAQMYERVLAEHRASRNA